MAPMRRLKGDPHNPGPVLVVGPTPPHLDPQDPTFALVGKGAAGHVVISRREGAWVARLNEDE
jgi:hypothetical protein